MSPRLSKKEKEEKYRTARERQFLMKLLDGGFEIDNLENFYWIFEGGTITGKDLMWLFTSVPNITTFEGKIGASGAREGYTIDQDFRQFILSVHPESEHEKLLDASKFRSSDFSALEERVFTKSDFETNETATKLVIEKLNGFKVPKRMIDENLLIATWNIKQFDDRPSRALQYIADILERFDIIALQEVKTSLDGFKNLVSLLPGHYRFLISDPTNNYERFAFIYDERTIKLVGHVCEYGFEGFTFEKAKDSDSVDSASTFDSREAELEAEIAELKQELKILKEGDPRLARMPYVASFKAGRFDFVVVNVHIFSGGDTSEDIGVRKDEIRRLIDFITGRVEKPADIVFDTDYFILGDFNILRDQEEWFIPYDEDSKSEDFGIVIPKKMDELETNLAYGKTFDKIVWLKQKTKFFEYDEDGNNCNIIPFHFVLYKDKSRKDQEKLLSDHFPLWVKLDIWELTRELEEEIEKYKVD